jgi:hypothetical protein
LRLRLRLRLRLQHGLQDGRNYACYTGGVGVGRGVELTFEVVVLESPHTAACHRCQAFDFILKRRHSMATITSIWPAAAMTLSDRRTL